MYLQERSAEPDAKPPVADGGGGGVATFGHYRLERELGRGYSSIVYAAHDDRRHRMVALKVLTFLQAPSEERQRDLEERFRREAQAVSTLSHPNIIAIYDVGRGEDGRQFIAMEYLPGETLRRRLNQEAPLPVPVTVAIGVRVAEALHYAHGRGIIHRDIKPDNIFLAGSGTETETPKLMDFGVAHVLSDQALTQDGMIIGSPAYMSPEQIHGLPPDARTDVFSLAVTLAEMATGVKPFEAETIPALMQKILHHDPDLRGVADRQFQRVLAKALAKNPDARYPDAGAFAQALRQSAPSAAPAPSIATQRLTPAALDMVPARPRRRLSRLTAAGLGGLALASLAALPLLAGQASPRTASVDPITATPPPPRPTWRIAPVQRADTGETARVARRQAPAPVRLRASASPAHRKEDNNIIVRIVESRAIEGGPSRLLRPALIARASQSPQPSATHQTASALAPATQSARAYSPHRAVPHRPVTTYMLESRTPRPIIRVAASRQELGPGHGVPPAATAFTDAPPSPLSRPMPPPVEGLDQTATTVRVRLNVSERGEVTEASILRSSGSRALDDAALDAVGRWQYAPALRDRQPVAGVAVETVKLLAAGSRQEQGTNPITLMASPPRPLSRPKPSPVDGLDGTDAVVRVRLNVSERGEVTEASILRSSGSRALDDAALDAVGRWQYAPALRDGQPVPGVVLETVRFAP